MAADKRADLGPASRTGRKLRCNREASGAQRFVHLELVTPCVEHSIRARWNQGVRQSFCLGKTPVYATQHAAEHRV
eukprot:CAMPEP_0181219124 /NCGR_PEP_ID=MMETSP1096-20121128/28082_1 /TAXON_ID=156174 ORGANISM="Chrysochromulina ericina, Strain CCMP281" /NCGR_SAMPLE_ID=MMETSP1096 /ASSEMBLY_ACC=CAM_ASM_000453 /LENGTH=75 /DNA_ID=CAMNT_0023311431 /DNA_START=1102 /DNA_END=1329 /DNA_ORIENTATION=+